MTRQSRAAVGTELVEPFVVCCAHEPIITFHLVSVNGTKVPIFLDTKASFGIIAAMTIQQIIQRIIAFLKKLFGVAPPAPTSMDYTLTGPGGYLAKFTLTLPVFSFSAGLQFNFKPQSLIVNGATVQDSIVVFSESDAGGLEGAFQTIPILKGPQIYSGHEAMPTLLKGTFHLADSADAAYTLVAG